MRTVDRAIQELPFDLPPPTECRLIVDTAASGAWNMAVDEVLWQWAGETGRCAWRLYGWSEPTLSLGYFQPYADRARHPSSMACPIVRRPSGGAAIVHDRELTYSLALPATHPLAAQRAILYKLVAFALIDALAEFGIRASLVTRSDQPQLDPQPFLCFQRRAPGDVIVGTLKVAGSAQRRSRQAVLQHGCVLLGRSAAAPEITGLESIAPTPIDPLLLQTQWLENLSRRLGFQWQPERLSEPERSRAVTLAAAKYESPAWTVRRGRNVPPAHTPPDCFDYAEDN